MNNLIVLPELTWIQHKWNFGVENRLVEELPDRKLEFEAAVSHGSRQINKGKVRGVQILASHGLSVKL